MNATDTPTIEAFRRFRRRLAWERWGRFWDVVFRLDARRDRAESRRKIRGLLQRARIVRERIR